MNSPIYLDYAATTPCDEQVIEKITACLALSGNFANAASTSHSYGWQACEAIENARQQVADLINADVREIVFTSGATEADNLALKGVAHANKEKGMHIITSAIEHKAVLDSCAQLEKEGFEVSYLQPQADGMVRLEQVRQALRKDTILVSIMHVNNETGVVNDIASIGELCREAKVAFHVDAAQSAGKLDIDVKAQNIDLLSLSAHKMYGPKGIGALFVTRQPLVEVEAQMHGGGHERGKRSGTLATHQIVGFGEACAVATAKQSDNQRIAELRDKLWAGICHLPGVKRNGSDQAVVANILNVCFSGVDGETLLMSLRKLAVSSGSACNSASMKPSYVLTAMGLADNDADSSIRFSLGRYTSEEDINQAIDHVCEIYGNLKQAV